MHVGLRNVAKHHHPVAADVLDDAALVAALLARHPGLGGQLLAARLEWNRVAYAVTDQRIVLRRGLFRSHEISLPLARLTWFRLQPHGEELGTLRILGGEGDPVLVLHCIEYPRRPAALRSPGC